ncbi:MAG: hypothetical protein OEZ38_13725, partial [Gammaproteobacteria bacterium]|nr:hypothetical protein [Gammaproteobacteria bacterium]
MNRLGAIILLFIAAGFTACKKDPGPGGNAVISGKVFGYDHGPARTEVTQITFTQGAQVEHGDYFLINAPSQGTYYYVWYDNPLWITNGDPGLGGRTGIQVTFNYTDDNLTIASNTASAIQSLAGTNLQLSLINDILTITHSSTGNVPDADNVTTPFEIDIVTQGKDANLTYLSGVADERVYIIYGDGSYYDESIRTDIDGSFEFTGLRKGSYTIYASSKDTISGY